MKKPKKPQSFIRVPSYRGGNEALSKFIAENLKYPAEALRNKVEGTVEVAYKVNGLGEVSEVKVIGGIGFGGDEEAVRLVKTLVYEKAVTRGLNTSFRKKLKIHFRLPTKKKLQMNYTLKESKPPKAGTGPESGRGYTITISLPEKKAK